MKEEWLMPGAVVPVDVETTAALVAEIKRLIGIVDDLKLSRQLWIELTQEEVEEYENWEDFQVGCGRQTLFDMIRDIESKLKEKNTCQTLPKPASKES